MKRFIKDGEIKYQNKIIVVKDGRQYLNPSEAMLIEAGWTEYIAAPPVLPTEEELFKLALQKKIDEILRYDSSDEINILYYQNYPIWLDKATRTGLMLRFQAERARGLENTTLWYGNIQFSLNIEDAIHLLYAIELYASACYDNTQKHLAALKVLSTIEELGNYNYKVGYPDVLRF